MSKEVYRSNWNYMTLISVNALKELSRAKEPRSYYRSNIALGFVYQTKVFYLQV